MTTKETPMPSHVRALSVLGSTVAAGLLVGAVLVAQDGKSGKAGQQRRTEPVRCRAATEQRLDHVFLDVATGDAIVAEGGCTLIIRHSRVAAPGWALVVEGGAEIVIEDSVIEGRGGSMNIADGGEVSSARSTFTGRIARRPEAKFVDKGGNTLP
jgi:hypothetical protein